jgi:hypothetical protein
MVEALAIATQYDHLHDHIHHRHKPGSSSGRRRSIPTVIPRTDKPSHTYCDKRGHDCYSRKNASKTHSSKS